MKKVKIFGRMGSNYMKKIRDWMGNHRIAECHLAFNYGLQGKRLDNYMRAYPQIKRLPIFNLQQCGNKYDHIKLAEEIGVPVPITERKPKERNDWFNFTWIKKPYYSLGGRDIEQWDGEEQIADTHYVQQLVDNRRYEVRVHAWAWIDPSKWIFQKRVHEEGNAVLAWNHHNGGKFITIDEPNDPLHDRIRDSVKKLMKKFGYQFGAVDFIIQNPGERGAKLKHYFIEWNLAPGWTLDKIEAIYKTHFESMEALDKDAIDMLLEGIFPWEAAWNEAEENHGGLFAEEYILRPEVNAEDVAVQFNAGRIEELVAAQHAVREAEIDAAYEQRLQEILEENEDADEVRYAEVQREAELEMNFCPECGGPVNRDIFGGLPKFCTRCGRKVR